MIKALLKAKEFVKAFYGKYNRYLNGLIRFCFSLVVYLSIAFHAGYNPVLSSPFVAVGLAVISAFLPIYMVTVFGALLLSVEFLSVSPIIAIVILVLFLLMLLLYFVFRANDSWVLMLTMTLCLLSFPPVVLPVALVASPIETIVVAFGVLIYGLVAIVKKDVSVLSGSSGSLSTGGKINLLLNDLFTNETFLLLMITLTASFLLISVIRRSKINHAPLVAIVSGDILFLISFLLGNYFLDIPLNFVSVGIAFLLNILIAFVMTGLVLSYDYKRTEEVQFEDDEYYYFVKAIPKTAIALTERKVEAITKPKTPSANTGEIDVKQVFVRREEEDRRKDRAE